MTDSLDQQLDILTRALDQAGDTLADVTQDQLTLPTPCPDWNVGMVISHLTQDLDRFILAVNGGEPDWSTQPGAPSDDFAADFRSAADALVDGWQQGGEAPPGPVWQAAEVAIHTWDLVRATGQDRQLDPLVAEHTLAFMSGALTPENRGAAFGAELSAPAGASACDRLAAFAGRNPA